MSDDLVFFCESTGKRLRLKGVTESNLTDDTRFFQSSDVKTDHRQLEDRLGCRLSHRSCIHVDHNENMRSLDRESEEFRDLVASVAKVGILQPLVVCRDFSCAPASYRLRTGFSRWEALAALNETLIPIRVVPAQFPVRIVQVVENIRRRSATHLEIAAAISEVKEEQELSGNLTSERQLADLFGFSTSSRIHDYLVVNSATETLKQAITDSVIPFSKGAVIATLPQDRQDDEIQPSIGMDLAQVRRRVSAIKNSLGQPAPKTGGKSTKPAAKSEGILGGHIVSYRHISTLVADLGILDGRVSKKVCVSAKKLLESGEKAIRDLVDYERLRTLEYVGGLIPSLDNDPIHLNATDSVSGGEEDSKDLCEVKPARKRGRPPKAQIQIAETDMDDISPDSKPVPAQRKTLKIR